MRLFRFQDITPAPLFLAYSSQTRLLQVWPLRIVGFEESDPVIQALFQNRAVRFLKEVEKETRVGQAIPYLAFSPFPLNQKEMEEILSDPDCQGLCLLTQSKEEINAFQDKNTPFLVRIFSMLIK